MPSFCVVSNCESKYASATNISFHKFPFSSPELLKKWIEFTDRPDWFPSKWSSICSRHFLPSDFRIQHLRKCLKPTAFPSVTMKSLDFIDFNSIPATDFTESYHKTKRIVCRLCARGGIQGQSKSILELSSTLIKCLPTIRLNTSENSPNEVCGDCIKKLVQYSLFIDRVASVQKDFFGIHATEADSVHTFDECLKESTTKPIIIKQEPVVNIKQEIFEFNKSSKNVADYLPSNACGQDYYTDAESDAYCEFCDVYFINNVELKNHIVDCHSDNPRERANNCEIMEIITLETAFIDLDENCVEEPTVPQLIGRALKVEKTNDTERNEVLIQNISIEHNYARPLDGTSEDSSIVRNLKQEEMIFKVKSLLPTKRVEQVTEHEIEPFEEVESTVEVTQSEIIEMDEHLAERCNRCGDVFDSPISLSHHMQTVHVPKTKICPICTAHCRTIYHYFIHRSKYHSWSKPRRRKRKLHFKCCDCSKMFLSKFAFDNHKKYSCTSLRFKCSICQLEFTSGMSMLIHKRICKILMAKSETVEGHAKVNRRLKTHSHRKEVNSSGRQSQQTPTRSTKLLRHQLHPHRSRDERQIKTTNVPESPRTTKREESVNGLNALTPPKNPSLHKEYICSCGKHFKTFQKFNAHQSAHTTDSPFLYNCNICNKEFRVRSYLCQHLVTHKNERKHKCTMCTKTFKRLAGLNQHVRGYHYKIKPHICTVCKHSYALKGDMRRCRHSTMQNKI